MNITVLGHGEFGTALSRVFATAGSVSTVGKPASKEGAWPERSTDVVFLCVPTQAIPTVINQRREALNNCNAVISCCKGLLKPEGQTVSEFLLAQGFQKNQIFALSGPSFAKEINLGLPTAVVLAGHNSSKLDELTAILNSGQLRIYKGLDQKGVELCGALKNVYAIASGVCRGLARGDSALAALTARALAEMARVTEALGAKPSTAFGLAGAGDLILTCSSLQSRNFRLGIALAQKRPLKEALAELGTVEGAWTTEVAQALCKKKKVRAPLVEFVHQVLTGQTSLENSIHQLLSAPARYEF